MNPNQIIEQTKSKFKQAAAHYEDELKKIRTGRAHPGMLDGVTVEAYGTQMPLIQIGSISVPEPQLLQITPFDPNNIQSISAAIRDDQSLGMNPSDDGRVVRIPIPPLNEERRREYVKLLHGKMEECMITLRNIRHEHMELIDRQKKDKQIGEDETKRLQNQLDNSLNETRTEIENQTKEKEKEMMTV